MTFDHPSDARVLDDALLRRLVEQSPAAMLACINGPRVDLISDRLLEITGYLRNELLGCDITEFIHEDDLVAVLDAFAVTRSTGRSADFTLRLRFADGTHRTLRAGGREIEDGLIVLTLDPAIGDHYSEVRRRLDGETLLERVNERFIQTRPDQVAESIDWAIGRIAVFLGADRGYVARVDDRSGDFHDVHEWVTPTTSLLMGRAPRGRLDGYDASFERLQRGKAVLHRDPARLSGAWDGDRAAYEADGITSSTVLPFSSDGRLAGIMGFDWESGRATWTTRDVPVLRSLATCVGQLFARARADTELAASLEQLRVVFADAPVPLILLDSAGVTVQANRRYLEMLGYDEDELVGQVAMRTLDPRDEAVVGEWLRCCVEADFVRPEPVENRVVTASGESIWVRVECSPIRDASGGIRYVACHVSDIGERKRTEGELERSEARFRSLADSLPDPIIRFSLDAKPTISNLAARQIFGEDMSSRNHGDRLLQRRLRQVASEAVVAGQIRSFEHDITIDGDLRYFQTRMLPEAGLDGAIETVLMMCTDMTERRVAEEELSIRASTDPLTGLLNRAAFLAELGAALERSDDTWSTAVLFCDLDRFKVVNDSLGHGSGDRLLVAVADRLRRAIAGEHALARLGGDEFTVLVESPTPERDAAQIARSVLAALDRPLSVDGRDLTVTASIGIAVGNAATRPDDVLRRADAAMYRAKDLGRARVALFDSALAEAVSKRLDLDQRLRRALERNEFRVVYQPEVDLATGAVLGAEALLRWEHGGEVLSPADFIEVAEDTGLIVPIGAWILREATRQAATWVDGDPEAEFTIRVNLSARQFDQPGLTALVATTLAESGLHPSRLCLEITETALMANADAAQQALMELSDLGVSLAIDDFGTGYSSLSYLKKFPVDVLKIDRTFVDGLPHDADDVAIVSTIVRLAESLEMTVTGEGVETEEQALELQRLGCRRAQGFLFARPSTPEVFGRLIDRRLPSAT